MDEQAWPEDAIELIVAQAKRVQRESRILVQQAARLRDQMQTQPQEGTEHEYSNEEVTS